MEWIREYNAKGIIPRVEGKPADIWLPQAAIAATI